MFFYPYQFRFLFSPSPCHIRLRVCWVVIFFMLFMENLRGPPGGGLLSCLRGTQDNNSAQNLGASSVLYLAGPRSAPLGVLQ